MNHKLKGAYMDTAKRFAQCSTAKKLQVGAVVVKDNRIISIGYNGMPSGWSNVCEVDGKTRDEVFHAEANAITKLAKSTESGDKATMFCTHSPCIHCAKLIAQSGITELYYNEEYRSDEGLKFLLKYGLTVNKLSEDIDE